MTAATPDAPAALGAPARSFSFETTYDPDAFAEKRARGKQTEFGSVKDQVLIVVAAIGVMLMFWRYTIALGVGVFAVCVLAFAMAEKARRWRTNYRTALGPSGAYRVGVNEKGFWLRGEGFFAESAWENLQSAFEHEGFILIHARPGVRVSLGTDELRAAGVYEPIHAIVERANERYRNAMKEARNRAELPNG